MYQFIIAFLLFFTAALYPIDVVYTWVDGSDTAWQKTKETYAKKDLSINPAVHAHRRFKDHEELKYSLRSIQAFAPWVSHIYIVTAGQRPKWLKDHPKISIVDHKAIFTHPNDLPTFNSMAIECHLHHIPNLAEEYLYFNDDVFLGQPVAETAFFTPDRKMKLFPSKRAFSRSFPACGEEGFTAATKNSCALLKHIFGKAPTYMHSHTPYPLKKSFVESLKKKFTTIFDHVSSHRFRSIDDFAMTNVLIPYAALYMNQAIEEKPNCTTVSVGRGPGNDASVLTTLSQARPLFFCIQDASDDDSPEKDKALHDFFEAYFPTPGPWEQ